ncbi:AP endonuclease superfamily protein [Clostridium tetanomorphum DSM 665]|uniref:Sugar phosphate isomerase/epimerase n=1 Tax=Clostridium tetanomorphum TaxID=1553 RepID=A0A923J225_CLOTT|nr:sugar phosphate isomerase/epimerase [Clostridium tetanomorphum]KAJ51335.1 AP endonuclease superfamily protein [Clostridium tetanomorphum DSM 665]MBC2399836.1 sugar phosphate isomerase/epimerase [Clostridium tetanomorphum]
MRIGLSSASFYPNIKTEESISLMNKLGFDIGEIFLNSPSEYSEDFAYILKEETNKYDFHINSVHSFSSSFEPYLFDNYKRRRDDMFSYFKKVCKLARIVGANCYTFHGMRLTSFKDIDKNLVVDIYNKLCYTALEEGIKLAQENVSWCMSSNLNFLEFLLEKCSSHIYFTFDIKQGYRANKKPKEYLNIMRERMINFHINDKDENNQCLIPGRGKVDYKQIYKNLCEIQYKGPGIIEIYSENYNNVIEIVNSKEFLKKIFV